MRRENPLNLREFLSVAEQDSHISSSFKPMPKALEHSPLAGIQPLIVDQRFTNATK
jgi:hypothetical protein